MMGILVNYLKLSLHVFLYFNLFIKFDFEIITNNMDYKLY